MQKPIVVWCCLAAMLLITACGQKDLVILAPDEDGAVGRITVSNAAGAVEIDRANQSTVVRAPEAAPGAPRQLDPSKVEQLFGAVIANQPSAPLHYRLHFESDSVQPLPAAIQQLPEIVGTIQQRMPTRVSVIGHTDTVGDRVYNVDLSLRRAFAIKQQLVDQGIDAEIIEVSSHGEENPLVKTADNVANAQNRRVEVVIR